MPVYKLRDTQTGRIVTVRGDSPPTDEDLDQIFAEAFPTPSKVQAPTHPLAAYMGEPKPVPSLTPAQAFTQPSFMEIPPPQPSPTDRYGTIGAIPEQPKTVPWMAPTDQPVGSAAYAAEATPVFPGRDFTYEEKRAAGFQGPRTLAELFEKETHLVPMAPSVEQAPMSAAEIALSNLTAPVMSRVLGEETVGQAIRSIYNMGAGLANFMASPKGFAAAAAAPVAPEALSAYFAVDMGASALDQAGELMKNWSKMSVAQRTDALTSLAGTAAFSFLATKHGGQAYLKRLAEQPAPPRQTFEQALQRAQSENLVRRELGFQEWQLPEQPGPIQPAAAPAATTTTTTEAPAPAPTLTPQINPQQRAARRAAVFNSQQENAGIDFLLNRYDVEGGSPSTIIRAVMEKYGFTAETATKAISESRAHYGIVAPPSPGEEELEALVQKSKTEGGLTPEERDRMETLSILTEQRAGMVESDTKRGAVDLKVGGETTEGEPFSQFDPDSPFTIDPKSNSVVVIVPNLKRSLHRWRKDGRTEEQIQRILTAMVNEEIAHLGTDRDVAIAYGKSLTAFERWVTAGRYQGRLLPGKMTDATIGWEALRFRLQQAWGQTPTEFTQMVWKQRWTWKALGAFETAVRSIRENFGSGETRKAFDEILGSITFAKTRLKGKIADAPPPEEEEGFENPSASIIDESGVEFGRWYESRGQVQKFRDEFNDKWDYLGIYDALARLNKRASDLAAEHDSITDPDLAGKFSLKIGPEIDHINKQRDRLYGQMDTLRNGKAPDVFLYDKLTKKPYNLTAEEVTDMISDYHNSGRQRLYELEPGLGRFYDLQAFKDKYRFFKPVQGETPGAATPRRRFGEEMGYDEWFSKMRGAFTEYESELARVVEESGVDEMNWPSESLQRLIDLQTEMQSLRKDYPDWSRLVGEMTNREGKPWATPRDDKPVRPTEVMIRETFGDKMDYGVWQATITELNSVIDEIRANPQRTQKDLTQLEVAEGTRKLLLDRYPHYEKLQAKMFTKLPSASVPGGKMGYMEWKNAYEEAKRKRDEFVDPIIEELGWDTENWPKALIAKANELDRPLDKLEADHPHFYKAWNSTESKLPSASVPGGKGRSKEEQRRAEDREKLRQMREKAAQGEMVPAVESTLMAEAHEPLTPERAGQFVGEFFSSVSGKFRDIREMGPVARKPQLSRTKEGELRVSMVRKPGEQKPPRVERDLFDQFANEFRVKFGPVPTGQLRDLLFEHAGEALAKASKGDIVELLRGMRLVKAVLGGGRAGKQGRDWSRLDRMADAPSEVGQLKIGLGGLKNIVEMRRALENAVRRAKEAKGKESEYRTMLSEATSILQRLRRFERPEGKTSGPIWDVDSSGKLVGRGRTPLPPQLQGKFGAQAERLALLRSRMDEILYPERLRRQHEEPKTSIEETTDPTRPGVTIQKAVQQKVPPPPLKPAFQPGLPKPVEVAPGERLRIKAITAILDELFKQAEQTRKPVSRKEVSPEDLGSPQTAKEPVFRTIRSTELQHLSTLGNILTSGSAPHRGSANHTHRLVVLLNKETGTVDMVDVYKRTGDRPGVMVRNPGLAETHQSLESVMRTHTPIYSVLLDDPIVNFRKSYKSVAEFMKEFGREAQERMRAMEYKSLLESTEEGGATGPTEFEEITGEAPEVELEPGAEVTSGTMARPEFREGTGLLESNKPLTDSEVMAIYDYLTPTNSAEGVRQAIDRFQTVMDLPAGERPLRAMSAIYKMMRHRLDQNPDMTTGDAMESIANFIYETNIRAATQQQLIERTLANYGGQLPETGPSPFGQLTAEATRESEARIQQQSVAKAGAAISAAKARGEIPGEPTVAPGTLPPSPEARQAEMQDVQARALSTEAVEEAMARGVRTPVKPTRPTQYDPKLSKAIQEEYIKNQADDSYFDKIIKAHSAAQREADIEAQNELAQNITEGGESMPSASLIGVVGKTWKFLTTDTVGRGMRIGSEWMVDRLRRVAPATSVVAQHHLDNANQIISRSSELAGDMNVRFGDDVMRASGIPDKANTWMNGFQVIVPKEGAIINAKEAIEGRLQPPAYARDRVALGQEGNLLMGEIMEPVSPSFIANGGMHNNLTAFGYDVVRDGPLGPYWEKLINSTVEANYATLSEQRHLRGLPPATVRMELIAEVDGFFQRYRRVLNDPSSDPVDLFKVNQDFAKKYPRAITHLWTGTFGFGHWEPVIHSGMFGYFHHGILRAAKIRAFREHYPPDTNFKDVIEEIRNDFPSKWHNLVNTLYRTLQGHPSENFVQTGWWDIKPSITQPAGVALRVVKPLGDTLKTGMLSSQILLQPAELMSGASSIFFGYRKSAMASYLNMFHRDVYSMLESIGAVDRILYDNSWDPNSKIRGAFRLFNNNARRWTGQNLFNEMQEAQAAGAAYIAAQRYMMANMIDTATGKPMIRLGIEERNLLPQTFRAMGFTHAEVEAMKRGNPELLGQMVRKAAAFASGGHVHPSQQSRLLANRAFQSMFWFQRYPMTRLNQFVRLNQVIAEEWQAGRKAEAAKASLLLAKFMVGGSAQGLIQTFIMTLFAGGWLAVKIRANEAADEKASFFFDMWRSTMGGPLQFITRGWADSGLHGVADNATRIAAPFNVAAELHAMVTANGMYRDMSLFDRIGKFLGRRIPMTKTVKLAASTIGLRQDNPELRASLAALGKWQRKKYGFSQIKTFWTEDESQAFRIQMEKAEEALKKGDTEAFVEARHNAVREKVLIGRRIDEAEQAVNAGFLRRRVLTHPQTGAMMDPADQDELEKHIGSEAMQRLRYFDKMLEAQAGKFEE